MTNMAYKIFPEKCIQHDACHLECPRNATSNAENACTFVIDQKKCNSCSNMSAIWKGRFGFLLRYFN